MIFILGLDPGLTSTGYGIISDSFKIIASGVWENKEQSPIYFAEKLQELLSHFPPSFAVLEDTFFHKNPKLALRLGEIKGTLLYILQKNKIPIKHLSAARLKKIITGNGRASKKQIKYMVSKFLGIKQDNSHIADAFALAIAGVLSLQDNALQYIRKNPS